MTNPFIANASRHMTNGELIQALRIDITGELETIVVYEAHVMSTTDERVKKVLSRIVDEEKRHVGELQQLVYFLSPKDEELIEQGKRTVQKEHSGNSQMPMQ